MVDGPGYTPGYDVRPSAASEPAAATPPQQTAPAASTPEPVRATPFVPARPTPFVPANQPVAQPPAALIAAAPAPLVQQQAPVVQQPSVPQTPAQPIATQTLPSTPEPAPAAPIAQSPVDSRPEVDLPEITDPLAWLESLTTPHPMSNLDYSTNDDSFGTESENAMTAEEALAWLNQLTNENANTTDTAAQSADQNWLPVTEAPVDETGGLSNDMSELQKWLGEQAKSLEELHDLPESATAPIDSPAAPVPASQLPDWLLAQSPIDDQEAKRTQRVLAGSGRTTDRSGRRAICEQYSRLAKQGNGHAR